MLTAEQIAAAKSRTAYSLSEGAHHEHDDCIRIAHEWLSAQERTKGTMRRTYAMKHLIERWGGRYVSQTDVEVAAVLLGLRGTYPKYNISSRLTEPDASRLKGIGEANSQNQRRRHNPTVYGRQESL